MEKFYESAQAVSKESNILQILKKYITYDNKKHIIKMKPLRKSTKNFDYETLKDWLKL